jgi:hypothetical protein
LSLKSCRCCEHHEHPNSKATRGSESLAETQNMHV